MVDLDPTLVRALAVAVGEAEAHTTGPPAR